MSFFKSLLAQFTIGALIIMSCISLLIYSQNMTDINNQTLLEWQRKSEHLRLELSTLQQQAQYYKLNAPRDYESYDRDKAVFFKQFKQQISDINKNNESLISSVKDINNSMLFVYLAAQPALTTSLASEQQWQAIWQIFSQDFSQALGKPEHPRLEWAAEVIIKNGDHLDQHAQNLSQDITHAVIWFKQYSSNLQIGLLIIVLGYILLSLIALAHFVLRPIIATTKACQRIAAGEYGLTINSRGSIETKHLQRAFNELSTTAKLIMGLLKDINQAGNNQQKLQYIHDSACGLLGINWIGLMALKDDNIELIASASHSKNEDLRHHTVSYHKTLGKEMQRSLEQGWFEIKQLRKMSLQHHDERFLREIHLQTNASQLIGHPFKCHENNSFLLLFTTKQAKGFSEQQISLTKALVKLMSDAIINGTESDLQPEALHPLNSMG